MSVFVLKILAVVSMIMDHLGYFLGAQKLLSHEVYMLMRCTGRLAFPIFAFLMVNGWTHSRDRLAYLKRLMGFALLSQPVYVLALTAANYSAELGAVNFIAPSPLRIALCLALGLLWYCYVQKGMSAVLAALCPFVGLCTMKLGGMYLLRPDMNVFYTLALALAAICVLDMIFSPGERDRRFYGKVLALLAALLLIEQKADYGLDGILLIVMLWYFRGNEYQQLIILLVWSALHYLGGGDTYYFIAATLAAVPLYFYNGTLGKPLKTVFYLVYPLHLSVLGCILIWQAHL